MKYRATANGFARPEGLTFQRFIRRGETFEFSGVVGSWMQPLDGPTPPQPKRNPAMHRTVEQLAPSFEPLAGQKRASTANEQKGFTP